MARLTDSTLRARRGGDTCVQIWQPIAFRGGDLSFTLTYRAGTVEESLVDRIWSSYEDILRRVAAGRVPASATFAQLGAAAA